MNTTTVRTDQGPVDNPDEKLFAFAEILKRLESANKEPVAILHKIEKNTAVLQKLTPGNLPAIATATAKEESPFPRQRLFDGAAGVLVGRTPDRQLRDSRERFVGEATGSHPASGSSIPVVDGRLATEEDIAGERRRRSTASTPTSSVAITAMPEPAQESGHQTPSERDNRGRFAGKSKSQEARAEQQDKDEKKSFVESVKDGLGAKGKSVVAANSGTLEEAAGRAAGGPIFEAAMELKGAVDSARDENSMIGKAARWAGKKTGISKAERAVDAKAVKRSSSDEIADAFRSHYSEEEIAAWGRPKTDASEDVVRAIMRGEKSDDERHQELIKAILKGSKDEGKGPKSIGLPYPRKTGFGASERRERKAKEAAKRTVFRPMSSAKKGSLASLPNAMMPGNGGPGSGGGGSDLPVLPGGLDKIVKVAAKVGPVLAALPLGAIAAGVTATAAVGAAGYSAVTGKDNFISKGAQKLGFVPKLETDASGKITGVADAGKGYTTTVDANGDLVKRTGARNWRNNNPGNIEYSDFAKSQGAMGSDGRFAVFPDYQSGRNAKEKLIFEGNNYKNKSLTETIARYAPPGENDTLKYQKTVLAAVGGQNKKMSEYSIEDRQKIMDSMEKFEGFKPGRTEVVGKVAQKPKTIEPVIEGEAIREKATATEIASVAQEPMATAIATPVKDMRQRIFSRTRERTAALGGGSLEAKPIEGGTMATEPATSLATGMPARSVKQPERITTARAEAQEPPSSISGPKQIGSDANGMFMAALDKLNATMAKMTGQGDATKPGIPLIRTEFDDTMLTLMAYDRV